MTEPHAQQLPYVEPQAATPLTPTIVVMFTSADMPSLDQKIYINPAFVAAVTAGSQDYTKLWAYGQEYQVRETVSQVCSALKWNW